MVTMRTISLWLPCLLWATIVGAATAADNLRFLGLGLSSQSRVVPGQVVVLKTGVGNPQSESVATSVVVTIEELPGLRCVRKMQLQPEQDERFELIIPLPAQAGDFEALHFEATLFIGEGEAAVIAQRQGAPAVSTLRLPVVKGNVFGMAMEPEPPTLPYWYWPTALPQSTYEMATAARVDAGGPRTGTTFEGQSLPLNQVQWHGLDLFVIAEPSSLEDPASVEALRKFMLAGGRLWVMLDKIPTRLLRPLLADQQSCEEVERVELNEFVIDMVSVVNPLAESDRRFSTDVDLSMVRVVQSGGRVSHSIDGWPAAFTMDVGYGQLLVTTLDSLAWITAREKQRSDDPNYQSAYQMRTWAHDMAVDANASRKPLPLNESVEYPLKWIGNPVVPRGWVAAALLGFCGVLLLFGGWCALSGRLVIMGALAPICGLLFSLGLLLAASWVRRDIPESVSRLQLVDVGPDGSFAAVREQTAMYVDSTAQMQLESQVDGLVRVDALTESGAPQLVVDDLHRWHVSNPAWPTGTWRYAAEYSLPSNQLVVVGRLDANGLKLQLPEGLPSAIEDPVLSFVTGDPLLCQPAEFGLRVDQERTVVGDRWISGSLISDEQQRRIDIYQQYFRPSNADVRHPTRRLYGWTKPWNTSKWNRELLPQGAALVSLPVRLERPRIGEEVYVPHGLVQLRRDLSSGNITTILDDYSGQWRTELTISSSADLELLLPEELIPMQIAAIELELDVRAPQRRVSLVAQTAGGPLELVALDSPSIPWKGTVTEPAVLQAMQAGRLGVTLLVSESPNFGGPGNSTNVVTWGVEHLHAAVRGQLLGKSKLSRNP